MARPLERFVRRWVVAKRAMIILMALLLSLCQTISKHPRGEFPTVMNLFSTIINMLFRDIADVKENWQGYAENRKIFSV